MNSKDFFKTKGFSPNWLEDTQAKEEQQTNKLEEQKQEIIDHIEHRKELNTLLAELEEIKSEFNKISEKKERLQDLLKSYSKFVFN